MNPGALLKERRKMHGLDQAELADRAGTSQGQVSRIERGAISPTIKTLDKLFGAMGDQLHLSALSKGASAEEPSSIPGSTAVESNDAADEIFYGQDLD